jgi:hypothetical protein
MLTHFLHAVVHPSRHNVCTFFCFGCGGSTKAAFVIAAMLDFAKCPLFTLNVSTQVSFSTMGKVRLFVSRC